MPHTQTLDQAAGRLLNRELSSLEFYAVSYTHLTLPTNREV